MRIVTWDMGSGPRQSAYRKHHNHAWSFLAEQLKPDKLDEIGSASYRVIG